MILVFGKTGQLGLELAKISPNEIYLDRTSANLYNPQECYDIIKSISPKSVINAAAYTNVENAEVEPKLAFLSNCESPEAMAVACLELKIPFLSISSDYVFDGKGKRPWNTDCILNPLNYYGYSKLAGEKAIKKVGGNFIILRTSWVFSNHGSNFFKKIITYGKKRDSLDIVDDQIGGPTPACELAKACIKLITKMEKNEICGTYHFSGTPDVSWASFASTIFKKTNVDCKINKIKSSSLDTKIIRPLNSRLDCSKLKKVGILRPRWILSIPRYNNQLK